MTTFHSQIITEALDYQENYIAEMKVLTFLVVTKFAKYSHCLRQTAPAGCEDGELIEWWGGGGGGWCQFVSPLGAILLSSESSDGLVCSYFERDRNQVWGVRQQRVQSPFAKQIKHCCQHCSFYRDFSPLCDLCSEQDRWSYILQFAES